MIETFEKVSVACSRLTTHQYSTSFSLGIRALNRRYRDPIYSIYGFVRFADEIVDTMHGYDKRELLRRFTADTWKAIEERISLNPILNSFQRVYHAYSFDRELVVAFLRSMEMDLDRTCYDRVGFEKYIYGSAEVVGLMCLHVFCDGDNRHCNELKPFAMKLGSAFQKVNFLRDVGEDVHKLGRTYFPGLEKHSLDLEKRRAIEGEIEDDFREALKGIRQLPRGVRFGVYAAYTYYKRLFEKIKRLETRQFMVSRIRISNEHKMRLLLQSFLLHNFNRI